MFISDKSSIVVFVLLCAIGGGLFHIIYATNASIFSASESNKINYFDWRSSCNRISLVLWFAFLDRSICFYDFLC